MHSAAGWKAAGRSSVVPHRRRRCCQPCRAEWPTAVSQGAAAAGHCSNPWPRSLKRRGGSPPACRRAAVDIKTNRSGCCAMRRHDMSPVLRITLNPSSALIPQSALILQGALLHVILTSGRLLSGQTLPSFDSASSSGVGGPAKAPPSLPLGCACCWQRPTDMGSEWPHRCFGPYSSHIIVKY